LAAMVKTYYLTQFLMASGLPLLLASAASVRILFAARDPAFTLSPVLWIAGVYLAATATQFLAMPVVYPHLLLMPQVMVSLLATYAFPRRRSWLIAVLLLAQLAFAHVTARATFESRGRQIGQFRWILEHVPADRPVLDSYSGLSAFHPIIGRRLYFSPIFERGRIAEDHLVLVVRGLTSQAFGAVVKDATYPFLPPAVRQLIEANYAPAPQFPDILLPRAATAP